MRAEAADRVRFGVETIPFVPWPVLRGFAQAVEDLGFDSLWLPDHPIVAGSATWTHLGALAEATRRVRLGPLVACVPYANPAVTARAIVQATTNFRDAALIAEVSKGLGEPMRGIELNAIPQEQLLAPRGW